MNVPMIEATNLTKIFGKGVRTVRAVDDITFTVDGGGVHGCLGPNGAGKTTTIKMLVGGLNITGGTARIKGYQVGSVKANSLIGYVSEHPHFYDMSLINYLIYMGRLGGLTRSEAETKAEELILWLELEEAADRKINEYSSGMKQKAALAQALIHEPEMVILDEPTANLDPIGRATMIKRILELVHDRGLTVFVSSHILSEVEQLADEVTIINKGKIILSDDVKSIKKHLTGNHYILETSDNDRIFKMLKKADYISRMWIDSDKNIQLVSDMDDVLQESLPKLLFESKITLRSFKQKDISLEAVADGNDGKADGKGGEPGE